MFFNRKLPHAGLKGNENELALAEVLKGFLPIKYGVETNALVIDRNGAVSRQCDIVIYDSFHFPKYFRKVYPVEIVLAVIEVKTNLSKQQVNNSKVNESALRALNYEPELTNYWASQTVELQLEHAPPLHCTFGYRSSTEDFGTFINWFKDFPTPNRLGRFNNCQPFNHFIACALDKGIVFCRGDGHISRWLAVGDKARQDRYFRASAEGISFQVDPAKSLLLFLETLWTMLEQSPRHPGFDIRSYMDCDLNSFVSLDHEGKVERR